MKVPLLDLKLQYKKIQKPIEEKLLKIFKSQYFILGPEVDSFEKQMSSYIGCDFSVGVSSGTDALLIALMAIDIKPGDEVIVPTYSFFATAGVVSRLNAVPVFVDIDPITFNIKTDSIEEKINERTKAIVPVHLYGHSAEMNEIMKIAEKHNLIVIEDAAQAIGTHYKNGKQVGTIGNLGCFSFFPSKNLGGFGDGGLVTTNDKMLYEKLLKLRNHGAHPKYYHRMIGGNFRLDAIQAAVLGIKLPFLDEWSEQRRENAKTYNELFNKYGLAEEPGKISFDEKNKVLLPKALYQGTEIKNYHIYNQYIIRVENRDALIDHLKVKEIGCEIYYPVPFHKQECFEDLVKDKNYEYPNSDFAATSSLALPIFPELTFEQQEYIVKSIKEFIK